MPSKKIQPLFTIETPRTREDAIGIGRAQLRSWFETYPNKEIGVDKNWIQDQIGYITTSEGDDFRMQQIERLKKHDASLLYKIVKDANGHIQGFLHVSKNTTSARLDAIYLTHEAQGTGVAYELMDRAVAFAGNLPIHLAVAAYNGRAVRFYEKYGFVKGAIDPELHRGKIPILNMHRKGGK